MDAFYSEKEGRKEEQALGVADRELLVRGRTLFEHFAQELQIEHNAMREARGMRTLSQASAHGAQSPVMSTLNSCIDNVIADQMDSIPQARLVPEGNTTWGRAREMEDSVHFVLGHAQWSCVYEMLMEDATVTGTGVAQVFWEDAEELVSVQAWHPEDFYPDPMTENIQDGRACFKVTHTTLGWVESRYPHVRGMLTPDPDPESTIQPPDGDAPVRLVEFWYKQMGEDGRVMVHMAQWAGGTLLLSTQTGYGLSCALSDGVFAHGEYPFILFRYRSVWGRPFGSGMVHDYGETQKAMDRYVKYIDDNARQSSIQRHFVRRGCGIEPEDVADWRKTVIEWEGSDIREVLQTVQAQPINGQVYQILQYMADAMKQDCGQNQFVRGEGGLNVTAGTAINALQQAGGKVARWHTARFKDAFRRMVIQILWVMAEYMTPGRTLRIIEGKRDCWVIPVPIAQEAGKRNEKDSEKHSEKHSEKKPRGSFRPCCAVQVDVNQLNPNQIAADNAFLLQAVEICAQAGTPLPASEILSLMQGEPMRDEIILALRRAEGGMSR